MILSRFFKSALLGAIALLFTACYYDPYYGGSVGVAGTYGYTGGGVSFVYTSSSRWFYDPGVCCYYDRYKRCYYDPWLGGYYPRNYCPKPIYNCPRPYGWNGRGKCPPPRNVKDHKIPRYKDRVSLLKEQNHSWARSVRERNDRGVGEWQSRQARNAEAFAKQDRPQNNSSRTKNRREPQLSDNRTRNQPNVRPTSPWGSRPNYGTSRPGSRATIPNQPQRQAQPQQSRPTRPPSAAGSRPGYGQPISSPSARQPSPGRAAPTARSQPVRSAQPRTQSARPQPAARSSSGRTSSRSRR